MSVHAEILGIPLFLDAILCREEVKIMQFMGKRMWILATSYSLKSQSHQLLWHRGWIKILMPPCELVGGFKTVDSILIILGGHI